MEAADLGKIYRVKIWHDNKNLDPSWNLDYVEVIDVADSNKSYMFHCERWLSKSKDDCKIERSLYVKVRLRVKVKCNQTSVHWKLWMDNYYNERGHDKLNKSDTFFNKYMYLKIIVEIFKFYRYQCSVHLSLNTLYSSVRDMTVKWALVQGPSSQLALGDQWPA